MGFGSAAAPDTPFINVTTSHCMIPLARGGVGGRVRRGKPIWRWDEAPRLRKEGFHMLISLVLGKGQPCKV